MCGDREWEDEQIIFTVLEGFAARHNLTRVIDGDARGADKIAGKWSHERDLRWAFPANWKKYGRSAGPIRNRAMLKHGRPDMVLAFHDHLEESVGTKDMVTIAKEVRVPVYVIARA